MQLFYNSEIKSNDTTFTFDKEESRHIIKVLRKQSGDKIHITNGLGFLFTSEIISSSEKNVKLKLYRKNILNQPIIVFILPLHQPK